MGFDRTSLLCLACPFDGTPQSQPAVRQYLAGNTGGRPSWGPGSQVDFGASVSLAVTLCISTIFCHCHELWQSGLQLWLQSSFLFSFYSVIYNWQCINIALNNPRIIGPHFIDENGICPSTEMDISLTVKRAMLIPVSWGLLVKVHLPRPPLTFFCLSSAIHPLHISSDPTSLLEVGPYYVSLHDCSLWIAIHLASLSVNFKGKSVSCGVDTL